MIMPAGQQHLLLPVRPWFIWFSLLLALLLEMALNMGLTGRAAWAPSLVAVTLLFWVVHEPQRDRRRQLASSFGLLLDVHQSGLLGQHALAFCVLGAWSTCRSIRHDEFHEQAEDNRIAVVPVPPARGLIYDRNGVLLAENVSAYTLELAPRQIATSTKTIDELAQIVEIGPRDRRRFKRLLEDTKNFRLAAAEAPG
jgi:hypothetical protein